MNSSRRLAAIMFTDIAGYTAMMQEDEAKAVQIRQRHREVFERQHKAHRGQIIQYYGDGTLSIFDSAVDAATCAVDMQKEFRQDPAVPLRIGIHTGDIMVNETEVIGDGVNVASRVESLAVPGSVLVSEGLFDNIKNQANFDGETLGIFTFKNVAKPVEVFALSGEGLEVPNPKKLTGKYLKRESAEKDWFQRQPMWLKYVAGFVLFLILSPLIYSPITSLFDAGAAPNMVVYTDDDGNVIERQIIPAEDRRQIYMGTFNNESGDSTLNWAQVGIPYAVEMDFDQDPYTLSIYQENLEVQPLPELIDAAKRAEAAFLIKGSYSKSDTGFLVTINFHEIPSGKLLESFTVAGPTAMDVADNITTAIKSRIDLPEEHLQSFTDLSVSSFMTENEEAYQLFSEAMTAAFNQEPELFQKFVQSTQADPTFSWSSFYYANLLFYYQRSPEMVRQYLDPALEHMGRLPDIFSITIKQFNYKVDGQPEKALKLAKLMTELEPGKPNHWSSLINESYSQEEYEMTLDALRNYEIHQPGSDSYTMVAAKAHLWLGQEEDGLQEIEPFLANHPKDENALLLKGQLLLQQGAVEEAREVLERGSFLHPENDAFEKFVKHCDLVSENGDINATRAEEYIGEYRVRGMSNYKITVTHHENNLVFKAGDQAKIKLYEYEENKFCLIYGHGVHFSTDSVTGKVERLAFVRDDAPAFMATKQNELVLNVIESLNKGDFTALEEAMTAWNSEEEENPFLEGVSEVLANQELSSPENPDLAQYEGSYENRGRTYGVTLKEDGLYLDFQGVEQALEPSRLYMIEPGKFLTPVILDLFILIETGSTKRMGFYYLDSGETLFPE